MDKKLEWFVFYENCNSDAIEPFNVFNSGRFQECLIRLKKEFKENFEFYGDNFDWFNKKLQSAVRYCFWAKCEYEIYLMPLFDDSKKKKIDVYAQLELNWDKFARYVFNNINLIKIPTKTRKKNK